MKIVKGNHSAATLSEITACLKAGGLVIFPTETTYGAGVDATNPQAVQKLLAYKSRREGKPLSIAVTDITMAKKYVEVNDSARRVYQRFLPGPVTVISKGLGQVAPGVESEFGTLGVRIPDYPLVIEMVQALGKPITATSANGSGEKRPYTIQDIFDGLSATQKSLIDLVVDAGPLPIRAPSTVIDTTLSTPVTLRAGELQVVENEMSSENGAKNLNGTHDGETILISQSEEETKNIAKRWVLKNWDVVKERGLMIGLDGALGTGKTIFTKGVAEFLQIYETITSPTYSYLETYDFERHGVKGQLHHLDVWKIENLAEFERLDIPSLLSAKNVIVVEWFKQVKPWLIPLTESHALPLLYVNFQEKNGGRQLHITEAKK